MSKNLKNMLKDFSEEKVNKIIEMIKKLEGKIPQGIKVKKLNTKSISIISNNFVLKSYSTSDFFTEEYCPILKLTDIKFKHVVKAYDYDFEYGLLLLEKLKSINLDDLTNVAFVKKLIYIVINFISNLFIDNSMINVNMTHRDIGIDESGIIKVFNFEKSRYINKENEFISKFRLYQNFKFFIDKLMETITNKNIKDMIEEFIIDFNYKLTDLKIYENPSVSGNYEKTKVRLFKFLDFNSIINYVKAWSLN